MAVGNRISRAFAVCLAGLVGLGAQAAPAPQSAANAAAVALRAGQPEIAEQDASTALDNKTLSPLDRAHALLNRALARVALGKRQDALTDFNTAIWMSVLPPGEKARALFDRGVTRDEMGRTEDAIADYSAALAIEPDYAAALNDRGNAERRLGRFAAARVDYQASLAAGNLEKKYAYFGLGEIAAAEGDKPLAADNYRAALAQDASYTIAAQKLASLGDVLPRVVLRAPAARPNTTGDAVPALRLDIADRSGGHRNMRLASLRNTSSGDTTVGIGTVLQLGAWRQRAAAASAWKSLTLKAGRSLDGLSPMIVAADIPGKGRYWRLRVGPLGSDRATALCSRLKANGAACMPVRD
jgi:tetratricopeptide (TPR) repeat protein